MTEPRNCLECGRVIDETKDDAPWNYAKYGDYHKYHHPYYNDIVAYQLSYTEEQIHVCQNCLLPFVVETGDGGELCDDCEYELNKEEAKAEFFHRFELEDLGLQPPILCRCESKIQ